MRKLEARLEKVADEKWNEDAATEDEEAAAGLSVYTPQSCDSSPLLHFFLLGKPLWELPLPSMFCLFPSQTLAPI